MEKDTDERKILILYNNINDMFVSDGMVATTNNMAKHVCSNHAGISGIAPYLYDKCMKITYYTRQKKWTYREGYFEEKPLRNPILIAQIKKELKRLEVSLSEDPFDDIIKGRLP